MANLNTTVRARLVQAKEPTIYNLAMPLANTEYSQPLSANTKKITLRMRMKGRAQIAFVSGQSATLFFTLEPGCVWCEENLDLEGGIIYLQSNVAGQVAEILEWT